MKLWVKVVPGSSQDCVAGWLGDTLKIRVSAAPEKGKANVSVIKVVSEYNVLGVPKTPVVISKGKISSRKTIEITAMSEDEVKKILSRIIF